jgi:hypothetical protein
MSTLATHVWRPSSARSITLDAFVPVARGAVAVAPPPLAWPTKDPNDVLDYQFNISPAVTGNDGDAIATLDVSIGPNAPGDLVLNSATADGLSAVFWFSGGQTGVAYTVTITVGTTNGRNLQRSVVLPVLSLSSPTIPTTALETDTGLMLVDQNGNPVLVS